LVDKPVGASIVMVDIAAETALIAVPAREAFELLENLLDQPDLLARC
jgi:hypothetical protein